MVPAADLVLTFIANAIKRVEKAAIFLFDEEKGLLIERSKGINLDIEKMLETGLLTLQQVDAAELSPGEFAQSVRRCIDGGARTIVIDSLNGYQSDAGRACFDFAHDDDHEPAGDHIPDRRGGIGLDRRNSRRSTTYSRRYGHSATLFRSSGRSWPCRW